MRERAWRVLYGATKLILRTLAKLYLRLEAHGVENIPRSGGIIIASNHLSHLDPPVLGVCVPRHIFHIAKKELAEIPPLSLIFRLFGTILIDRKRGQKALKTAQDYLERGLAIIVFPEGTRSETGRLGRGRTGTAVIALKTGAPVVPSAVIGTDKSMKKRSRFIKPAKVIVKFGKPIYFGKYEGELIPRNLLIECTARIMDAIEELLPPEMRPSPEEKALYYPRRQEEMLVEQPLTPQGVSVPEPGQETKTNYA